MKEYEIIEKSMSVYPGKIATLILPEDIKNEKFDAIKKELLENPVVSAVFVELNKSSGKWEKLKGLIDWAKNNNLNVGVGCTGTEEILDKIIENKVDFIRVSLEQKIGKNKEIIEKIKKKIAKIRAEGINYEFCLKLKKVDLMFLEEIYKTVSPCKNFVIQSESLSSEEKEKLMEIAIKNDNILLRLKAVD